MESAFTLVELLIVIGIIGVLAVTLLISLNPAEAQRKTRDAKRLKDLSTIQSIIEQAFSDGLAPTAGTCDTGVGGTPCKSQLTNGTANPVITVQQQSCNANFLNMNVCNYAKFIPLEPLNGRTGTCRSGANALAGCAFGYYFNSTGTDYELNARQESATNATKLTADAGNNPSMIEIFTNMNTLVSGANNP